MKTWLTIIAFLVNSTLLAAPTKQQEAAANLKPLTFENVVSFFKQAHLRPTEVQKRCTIFFEGEWKIEEKSIEQEKKETAEKSKKA